MNSQGNSASSTSGSGRKEKQPSHTWTPVEDVALVEALTELCVSGNWKADNGFKSGYLTQLEKIIGQKLPNCGLKADPHIVSRVKTLKKQTLAISDMISNSSGFSWDHENKMIVCEKQVFDDWVKVSCIKFYDVLEAAAAIIGDDSKIELFFSLPDNLKRQWIYKLLNH